MKQVFRGYPQALAAAETGRKLMPYMVYKKDSQPPESGNAGRRKGTESEYLKGMYPLSVKRCQCLVEEACDRLDYSGSPMYDEYPDRWMMRRLCGKIEKRLKEQGEAPAGGEQEENLRDLIEVLLYHEIYRRRCSRRKCRTFF